MIGTKEDYDDARNMFNQGKSTYEVQIYFAEKYNLKHSAPANFLKRVRKQMGIYNAKPKVKKGNHDAECTRPLQN